MEIDTTQYKHCDLIQVVGRVDSYTAPQLGEAFDEVTGAGRYKIVFDMEGIDFMSSAGLGTLIGAQKTCKRYNRGEVVLVKVPQRIYEALELAGFVPLFRFYDNITDAVGNF